MNCTRILPISISSRKLFSWLFCKEGNEVLQGNCNPDRVGFCRYQEPVNLEKYSPVGEVIRVGHSVGETRYEGKSTYKCLDDWVLLILLKFLREPLRHIAVKEKIGNFSLPSFPRSH
jgi:hypothetical protein